MKPFVLEKGERAVQQSTRNTIEQVVKEVVACDTVEQVIAYGNTLPEDERWMMRCAPCEECRFLQNPDGSFKEFDGLFGENTVAIPFSDKRELADKEDAIAAFTELFHIISSELVKAKQMGKAPHINIGETHLDIGSSFYNIAALYVAKHLGFTQIGIENELEDRILSNGKKRPGLYNWGQIADEDGKIPQTHPEAVALGGRVQNRQAFIPLALKLFGKGVFPTDLYIPDEERSVETLLDKREKHMLEQIRKNTDGKSPVMHLCGCDHCWGLNGFVDKKKIHPVSIIVRQAVYLTPPNLENSLDDLYKVERTAEADYRPLLHGRVKDINHSVELAEQANIAVGGKLAAEFFNKHPEMRSWIQGKGKKMGVDTVRAAALGPEVVTANKGQNPAGRSR